VAIDVTDQTFEHDVLVASETTPVVIDLWAPWCGPCRTLGPILEKVVDETGGRVRLAKVNVDENPRISASFQVQSIPAVYAVRDRKVVDSFIGALPERAVRDWVERLAGPAEPSEVDRLVAAGDEASLRRAVELEPAHEKAIVALAELLVAKGEHEEALGLLAKIPETTETRRVAALARLSEAGVLPGSDPEARFEELLKHVKTDEGARQQFLDLLETLPDDDPRKARWRRALTSRLF
jgi:putative thioredoxin